MHERVRAAAAGGGGGGGGDEGGGEAVELVAFFHCHCTALHCTAANNTIRRSAFELFAEMGPTSRVQLKTTKSQRGKKKETRTRDLLLGEKKRTEGGQEGTKGGNRA